MKYLLFIVLINFSPINKASMLF